MDDFGTEAQYEVAVEAAKWPNGFLCVNCGHNPFSRLTRGRTKRQCNKCKYQTSLMAGTIFHGTKLQLTKWFLGMHLIGNSRDSKKTAAFDWVNTILGNLKTALARAFHNFTVFAWYRIVFCIIILATAYFGVISWSGA